MRALLAICLFVSASFVWANENSAPASREVAEVKGLVLEVKDVENYTYLRLKTRNGETWAAVNKAAVKKGDAVTIENATVINNFQSKSLKKTFPSILFGTLGGSGAGASSSTAMGRHVLGSSYTATPAKQPEAGKDEHVDKASGAEARTVAEIITNSAELKDKPVLVRGRVVKFNPGIMGRNWVHLRDGSGLAADASNDLLVTTMSETRVGAVVTAKGIVRADKDFGAGYVYKTLVEEATLQ